MNKIFSFPTGLKARSVLTAASLVFGVSAFVLAIAWPNGLSQAHAAAGNQCIITIFGQQYDVTALGTMHSGPQGTTLDAGAAGFFQCGTDMSTVYQSQHGTNVSRLSPFIYVAPTATPTPTATPVDTLPTPTPTPTGTVDPVATPTPIPTGVVTTPGHHDEDNDDEYETEESDDHHSEVRSSHKEDNHENNRRGQSESRSNNSESRHTDN